MLKDSRSQFPCHWTILSMHPFHVLTGKATTTPPPPRACLWFFTNKLFSSHSSAGGTQRCWGSQEQELLLPIIRYIWVFGNGFATSPALMLTADWSHMQRILYHKRTVSLGQGLCRKSFGTGWVCAFDCTFPSCPDEAECFSADHQEGFELCCFCKRQKRDWFSPMNYGPSASDASDVSGSLWEA